MSQSYVGPQGSVTVTVPAGEKLAVYSMGTVSVYQVTGYANSPSTNVLVSSVTNGQYVTGAYTNGATLVIENGNLDSYYAVGTAPVVGNQYATQIQGAPVAVDATGAVSSAAILGGIVTSSTAAAVAGTVPTGTVLEAACDYVTSDSYNWSVINTGPNTFTVTAASGHTLVGSAAVATGTSGYFRTRRSALETFITYRLS